MFSDVEIGLAMKHRRDLAVYAADAQEIVDGKNIEIARLRSALAETHRQNGDLILARGQSRNEILAKRLTDRH